MKKICLGAFVVAFGLASAAGTFAAADVQPHEVRIPSWAAGVTEEQFHDIQDDYPCGAKPLQNCPTTPGLLFFRVSNGAMVQTVGRLEGSVFTVRLKRYLPDGLYTMNKKVVLVKNGRRFTLTNTEKSALSRTIRAAQRGAAAGINTETLELMVDRFTACQGASDVTACRQRGEDLTTQFAGQLVLNTETGKLFYIPQDQTPVKVQHRLQNGDRWIDFLEQAANHDQSDELVRSLPTVKTFGF